MKREKAALVTAMLVAFFMSTMAMLYLLGVHVLFFVIAGVFALGGLFWASAWLLGWLADDDKDEADLDPVEVHRDPEDAPVIDTMTYDEIKREIEKEKREIEKEKREIEKEIGGDEA